MKVRYDTETERKEMEVPDELKDKHPVELAEYVESMTDDDVIYIEILQ